MADARAIAERLKIAAAEEGFSAAGICDATPPVSHAFFESWLAAGRHGSMGWLAESVELRRSIQSVLPGARSALMVALNYAQPRPQGPKIARYALGRDYHRIVRRRLVRVARQAGLEEGTYRACADSAPILEREMANRAGLGWFGKNTCLIDSRRGSWFLIGCLLTTLELPSDRPAEGGCGTCRACVDACPTGAIVFDRDRWQVDSRRCISYLTIERRGEFTPGQSEMTGDWLFGCDVCQEVCPFNAPREGQPLRAQPTQDEDLLPRRTWPPLEEVAELDESEWSELTEGSAIRRTGHAGLRRNARAALRNRDEV